MRQNTLSVIGQQVCAQTPPDHAGVECDDGDASAQKCFSCWAVFYDGGVNESRLIATVYHIFNRTKKCNFF